MTQAAYDKFSSILLRKYEEDNTYLRQYLAALADENERLRSEIFEREKEQKDLVDMMRWHCYYSHRN